jgi:hypothetical protein
VNALLTAQNAAELNQLVGEASRSLVRLDADRLEELALSCQAFQRSLSTVQGDAPAMTSQAALEVRRHMATFGRVLEVTHGNLDVSRQIRNFEAGLLEYMAPASPKPVMMELRDGNN